MADNDTITVVGTVGFDPDYKVDGNGLPRVTLRLASDQRRKNRETGAWENGDPNWYSIIAFRYLATNIAASVKKGERVIVTGNLKLREWVDDGVKRVRPEIVASSVGHDLNWGTSSYTRPVKSTGWHPGEDQPLDGVASSGLAADAPVAEPSEAGSDAGNEADGGADDETQPSDGSASFEGSALAGVATEEMPPVF